MRCAVSLRARMQAMKRWTCEARKQTVARKTMDGPPKLAGPQRQHLVDRREPRAQQQDLAVLSNMLQSAGGPGIGNIARAIYRLPGSFGLPGGKFPRASTILSPTTASPLRSQTTPLLSSVSTETASSCLKENRPGRMGAASNKRAAMYCSYMRWGRKLCGPIAES